MKLRRVAAVLASCSIVVGLAGCHLGVGDDDSSAGAVGSPPTSPPERPERPARYTTCPSGNIVPPAVMVLVDRELPNLGAGVLGRVETYDEGSSRLQIAVGVDVLAQFEDLDFTTEQVALNGGLATVSTAGAFGLTDQLVVVTWTERGQPSPCASRTLVGSNIDVQELIEIASSGAHPDA